MKHYYSKKICESCGDSYDPTSSCCPKCKSENREFNEKLWINSTPIDLWREIVVFAITLIGFQIIAVFIGIVLSFAGLDPEGVPYLALVNYVSYGLTALALGLVIWNNWPKLARLFKEWRTYIGLGMGLALIFFNIAYSYLLTSLGVGENGNQSTIIEVVTTYPLISVIFLGILGPICEEIGYRLGLFDLLKRYHIALAYVLVPILFGFIHFDFTNIASLTEWANLPNYIICGLILSFTYDRFGLGASSIAHIMNNALSIVMIIFSE